MIQLRKDTDQSLLILSHLLRQEEGHLLSATMVSENLKLPYPTVSKIMKILNKNDLLVSVQGPKGGYAISDEAKMMSVGHVIELIEGPIALTVCSASTDQTCESQSSCGIHPHMIIINRLIRSALMQLPLYSLVSPLKKIPKNEDIQAFWKQFFTLESRT